MTALAAADILRLERVDPTTAPGPLPGIAVSPLVAVTLAGGGTALAVRSRSVCPTPIPSPTVSSMGPARRCQS